MSAHVAAVLPGLEAFALAAVVPLSTAARPQPVTFGSRVCPTCSRRVKIAKAGGHLRWDHHERATWGGIRLQCSGAGAPVCEAPPLHSRGALVCLCAAALLDPDGAAS